MLPHIALAEESKKLLSFLQQHQYHMFLYFPGKVSEKHIQEEHNDDRREGELCEEAKEESSIVTKHETRKLSRTTCAFGCFEVPL